MTKIAVCFFGITRSLTYTYPSITRNVLGAARALGDVKIFGHFFEQPRIVNPRSGEDGATVPDEHRLLEADWLQLEPANACLEHRPFAELKGSGDAWNDDFQSLRNLIHQLHSLETVWTAAMNWGPDLIVFARPDLEYHDSLAKPLGRISRSRGNMIFLPSWQHHDGGYNDRFAICTADEAAWHYATRLQHAVTFCTKSAGPLHAEQLLRFALVTGHVRVRLMTVRASRVRLDGTRRVETFRDFRLEMLRRWIRRPLRARGKRNMFAALS